MKKAKFLTLLIIFLLLIVSCTNGTKNVDKQSDRQKEVTILLTDNNYEWIKERVPTLINYKLWFEQERGVRINFDIITANNDDEYEKKKNTKLYLDSGPTLIFVSPMDTYKNYIDQGIAIDAKGKIPNLENVYSVVLDDEDYFIPIGIDYWPTILNKSVLERLGLHKPKFGWTRNDYLRMKEMSLKIEPQYFTRSEYFELLVPRLNELGVLDEENNTIILNNQRVIQCIKEIREEIFSDKYILNENYTYENYYNLIYERDSEEYKESSDLEKYIEDQRLIRDYLGSISGLKSLEVDTIADNNVILPNVVYEEDDIFDTWGFIVNANGKNIELGMEFINELLEDDNQLEMFTQEYSTYPVNKEVEDEISKIEKEKGIKEEAIELRKYLINQIELGNYERYHSSRKKLELQSKLYLDFVEYVFADEPYTDEELSGELQKLETKYRIWLNE